jgi:mannose-6-phosphate isomerase-like protein (cupin superfamily)
MITPGDVLEHPVTGETIIFRRTAAMTGGKLCEADFYMRPGAFVAAEHIHPQQTEHFEVVAGTLRGRVAGKELAGGPGETVVVPPGTPHVWWNAGGEPLHVRVEVRPALSFEGFFEAFFGLAQDGKVSRKTGLPNPLQMAVLLRAYRDVLILAQPPRAVQTLLFGPLAALGRLLGYRADYPYPYPRPAQVEAA